LSGSVVVAYVGPGGNVITQIVNFGEQFDINTGLVTPIDVNVRLDLIRDSFFFNNVPQPITFIAPDQRVYFVSPVTAAGGGGGEVIESAKR
jgi:hypothetical protein